jgi:short-subunit dehydrogenase
MGTRILHAAVTGASSGIGAAIARELARAGASVTLVARRRDALEALADELRPARTHVAAHDLGDRERACDWIAEAEARLGPIDVLVNNAGALLAGASAELDPAEGEKILTLDLLVPLRLTRHVLPAMLARRAGTIVDVSALAALTPLPGLMHYDAAKAGLAAASEALRAELRGSGVHVVTVYPGYIDTEMARAGEAALETSLAARLLPRGSADELARRVRLAVERRRDRVLYPFPAPLAFWFTGALRLLFERATPPLRRSGPRA